MLGSQNALIGHNAGKSITTGSYNAFIGDEVGYFNTTGQLNIFIGARTGYQNTTGESNAFIGANAGYNNTIGSNNSFIGYLAGYSNISGISNSFIGNRAGYLNITGKYNSFIGYFTGYSNTSGNDNAFIGSYAGNANTTGNDNAFFGHASGAYNTTGTGNAFVGTYAGYNNTTGVGNTYVGLGAGGGAESSYNTFLGANAGSSPMINNAVAIGHNAIVNQNNSMVLGGTGVNSLSVGIGTEAPQNTLEITQGTPGNSGLRLTNLTSAVSTTYTTDKFLTVTASGDVVLATSGTPNLRQAATAADGLWQTSGEHLQNNNSGGVIIGQQMIKTPSDYKLFVEKGILTEKVKVAIKNTSEWSDKVFERGYQLKSLGEVEQHIQQQGHLPGVPSATEVVEKGIDVAKMDAKLLEKIEELTLYSIQLEKTSQQQQAKIDELERLVKGLLEKK
ncbi:autotransporter outer membrane beta-barrel domain-containing protein [Spirosoma arboris]|nr:hypothetical protein [Spirosoma arboris]